MAQLKLTWDEVIVIVKETLQKRGFVIDANKHEYYPMKKGGYNPDYETCGDNPDYILFDVG
jgi:hypothetical protein